MHPILSAQLATEHHHDLLRAAPPAAVRPAGRRSPRTAAGLALVRVGLRLSQPLTPDVVDTDLRLAVRPVT